MFLRTHLGAYLAKPLNSGSLQALSQPMAASCQVFRGFLVSYVQHIASGFFVGGGGSFVWFFDGLFFVFCFSVESELFWNLLWRPG